jgi:MYXO-CTERM domain-containing protein
MKLHRALLLATLPACALFACAGENTGEAVQAALVSPDLVISQVYGAGGNAGATYTHDFVEIFNRGSSPVQLQGYSLQYASAAGTFSNSMNTVDLPSFSLQPGQYFLVQFASGGANGVALPTPDATGTTNLSATAGKVAISLTSNKLNGCGTTATPCSANDWIDLVGYGGTAQQYEGTAAAPAPSNNTTSMRRASGGCVDTGDNASDLAVGAVSPRNSASSTNLCDGDAGSDAAVDGGSGGGDGSVDAGSDADMDAGSDADMDAGSDADMDAGSDADTDAGSDADMDAGSDAGLDGGGTDGSVDAGTPILTISQVYGGGGNANAPYMNDFVEILNRGDGPAQMQGYSIQYASATGLFSSTGSTNIDLPAFTLQPGRYFLVQLASSGGVGQALPTPDATGMINMGGTAGKVALVATGQKLNGCGTMATPCAATWIDFVGYGTTAEQYEGSGAAPAPSNTNSARRVQNGCVDTNDNKNDFAAGAPTPRNSSITAVCSGGGDAGTDGGTTADGGADAGKTDAGADAGKADGAPDAAPSDAATDGASVSDGASTPDARPDARADAGAGGDEEGGCSCSHADEKAPWSSGALALAVGVLLRRRRRAAASGA